MASSLAAKAGVLAVIFVACPLIVYFQLRDADNEKTVLLLRSLQEQGGLIAEGLKPLLHGLGQAGNPALQKEIEKIASGTLKVKVLFRPKTGSADAGFFYVASSPPVSAAYLDEERQHLIDTGIFDKLGNTCEGNQPLSIRYTNPAGERELLSSITPVLTAAGCWVVLTSYGSRGGDTTVIGQPYWRSPQVRIAAAIYVTMAALVFSLFFGIWMSLRRFAGLAQKIGKEGDVRTSFAILNRIPELSGVATEFDQMVGSLRGSARAIRSAAEENAHAFKTPIAVIAQSIEPLRRSCADKDEKARRALNLIERSVERLDALVNASRHMDEAIADLITPPRERVDLSELLVRMVQAYSEKADFAQMHLDADIASGVRVLAGADLLETVIENVLDNAFGFAPQGSTITVQLSREGNTAVMTVADEGPGVDPRNLDRIFERYFSDRARSLETPERAGAEFHFGMGLWIVRRNVEAVGGTVSAVNRAPRGFLVTMRLPLRQ